VPRVLRELLDALPHVAWLSGPDGSMWYVNDRGRRYCGRAEESDPERVWHDLLHADDLEAARHDLAVAIASELGYEAERRLRRADGAYRWHVARLSPVQTATGDVSGWVGTYTDVHERHLLREATTERSEAAERLALLDTLQARAPIGFGFLDQDLRFREVNAELARIDGIARADHLGRRIDHLLPDLMPDIVDRLTEVLTRGVELTEVECSAPAHDGSLRHRLVSLYPVEVEEQRIGVGLVVHDVTERVEQSRRVARSEAGLAEAERVAHIGSWELVGDPPVGSWSDEVSRILGMDITETPSVDTWLERVHPADLARVEASLGHAVASGGAVRSQHRIVRPDGAERVIDLRAVGVVGADGAVQRLHGTVQDVTDRALAEQRARSWAEVIDHMPVGVAVWAVESMTDPVTLRLVEVNRAALSVFPASDAVAASLTAMLEDVDAELGARFRRAIRDRTEVDLGDTPRSEDGSGPTLRVRVFPLPAGLYGATFEDVTDHRRLQAERAELLQRSVDAASVERERLADQLHDDVVQLLTAALLRVDLAGLGAADGPLQTIREPLDEAVRSLRRTMLELAPTDLRAGGLEAAVGAYAERLLEAEGVSVDTSIVLGDARDIASATLSTANRILQEAISNVRRHADASHVAIRVARRPGVLAGEVRDDGRGIEPDHASGAGHHGLRLMRDRAEVVGGTVSVERHHPDGGTIVAFSLPIDSA
jgi:PAS domain S-box-containing protein